jgi:hypothetical protein
MYVSVTGLKTKGFVGWIRFWMLAIPAFRAAQQAEGCRFCETKTLNGYHHTLTVWENKRAMMKYRASPAHLKSLKAFSKVANGKVYGFEATSIPSWTDALKSFNKYARDV